MQFLDFLSILQAISIEIYSNHSGIKGSHLHCQCKRHTRGIINHQKNDHPPPGVFNKKGSCIVRKCIIHGGSWIRACFSFIISLLLSTAAVRISRSSADRTSVNIIAACSLAQVGQSSSKASCSSSSFKASLKVLRSIIILSWRRVLMLPLWILPKFDHSGVEIHSDKQNPCS